MNTIDNFIPCFTGRLWGAHKRRLGLSKPCKHNWKTDCSRCSHTYWVIEGEHDVEGVCDIYLREHPEGVEQV